MHSPAKQADLVRWEKARLFIIKESKFEMRKKKHKWPLHVLPFTASIALVKK